MNEVELLATEVSAFYHTLMKNNIDAFTAAQLTASYIATRLQYGKFPEESPFIPFDLGDPEHDRN
jgi:hypothetical protein